MRHEVEMGMMRELRRGVAAGLMIMLTMCAVAHPAAAPSDGQNPSPVQPRRDPEGRETARNLRMARELLVRLDELALAQAQRQLELNEPQAKAFVQQFRALQEVRRRYQQQRHQLLVELRRLTNPFREGTDLTAIAARLTALSDLDRRAADEIRAAYDAIDQTLDSFQQARFRIFEDRMEERKLDLLMRARERAGRGGPVR